LFFKPRGSTDLPSPHQRSTEGGTAATHPEATQVRVAGGLIGILEGLLDLLASGAVVDGEVPHQLRDLAVGLVRVEPGLEPRFDVGAGVAVLEVVEEGGLAGGQVEGGV